MSKWHILYGNHIYSGYCNKDIKHGSGTYYFEDGSTIDVNYLNGNLVDCVNYWFDNKTYSGMC